MTSSQTTSGTASKRSVLIISAVHDYRMLRRGSIQSIADAFARRGYDVTFFSMRFSFLSLLKGDSRSFLWRRRNRPENVAGIRCYLWFTALHPFEVKSRGLRWITAPLFFLYPRTRNDVLDSAIMSSSIVMIESGLGILFAPRVRSLNAKAALLYRASDNLDTIGAPAVLQHKLEAYSGLFDRYCLLAARMAPDFAWGGRKVFPVPLGITAADYQDIGPSPYTARLNAVSVGSMLFDRSFFLLAAEKFPDVMFHVIGSQQQLPDMPNVRVYDEMKFKDTLPFIKHATFGIAPYLDSAESGYLSQSSLKLMQYEYLGIPAVCPHFAVRPGSPRYGYQPGDARSIVEAIDAALRHVPSSEPIRLPSWDEVADRLIDPEQFADCDLRMTPSDGPASADRGGSPASRRDVAAPAVATVGPAMSLIVCTVGRTTVLERLFESLAAQTNRDFEVVLVDQNPPGFLDGIVDAFSRSLTIAHVRAERGLSRARNIGLRRATGRIVGFPDDDCWYPGGVTEDVSDFFLRFPEVDVLLGRTLDADGVESLSQFRPASGTVSKRNIWTSGNSNTLFVQKSAADRIGGFDESLGVGAPTPFQSGEETDYVLRALALDMRVVHLRELCIHHEQIDGGAGPAQVQRAWRYAKGFGRVLRVHHYGLPYLLYRVLRSFGGAAVALVVRRGYGPKYRAVWAAGTLVGYFSPR